MSNEHSTSSKNEVHIDSREAQLLHCPFCGHEPFMDNLIDSLHITGVYLHFDEKNDIHHYTRNPEGALAAIWEMNCLDNEGGCGANVSGEEKQGAIDAWNRRPAHADSQTPEVEAESVAWTYCPECGCEKSTGTGFGRSRYCDNCGQEWFPDINYSETVHTNLTRLYTKPQPQEVVASQLPGRSVPDERKLKELCTGFYCWWLNQPGSNIDDGFNDWMEHEGREMLSAAPTQELRSTAPRGTPDSGDKV